MTLRAGHYRGIQLPNDDGTPVIGPGGREVWVTRCGAELLGTRTDGGDATKNIAYRLGTRVHTVEPTPVPGPSPGPPTVILGPGGGFLPVGGGFQGGEGGDGGAGTQALGGGGRVVPEDKEVWVVKPCTRTPGPPLGPFPLGNHLAANLHATHDDGTGPRAVYADGCVECEVPCPPPEPTCPYVGRPSTWFFVFNGVRRGCPTCDLLNGVRVDMTQTGFDPCRWQGRSTGIFSGPACSGFGQVNGAYGTLIYLPAAGQNGAGRWQLNAGHAFNNDEIGFAGYTLPREEWNDNGPNVLRLISELSCDCLFPPELTLFRAA
jgi:hypothetical protein